MTDVMPYLCACVALVVGWWTVRDLVVPSRRRRSRLHTPASTGPAAVGQARPDHTRIAVLEHDLLGIAPAPGSQAAVHIASRTPRPCIDHEPIDTTGFGDPAPSGMCAQCGTGMVQDTGGDWVVAQVDTPATQD